MSKTYDEVFESSYAGHFLCSCCGHEMAMHDAIIDHGGITRLECHERYDCFCGKGHKMPYGYFEIERKPSAAQLADIVLGRNADGTKWVTMRYNHNSGKWTGIYNFIGQDVEQRARHSYHIRHT